MSDQVTRVKIFVASPSDTGAERDLLEGVVAELNRGVARASGIVLELIRWETHVRPGIGTDAQDVINRQVPEGDVLIALFWKRLGTPTPRAASGSVEELEAAIKRWHRSHDNEILVYFNQLPYNPEPADLEQIQRLFAFRKQIEELGVLVWTYEGSADFEMKVREHLTGVVAASTHPPEPSVAALGSPGQRHRWVAEDDMLVVDVPVRRPGINQLVATDLDIYLKERGFSRDMRHRATTCLYELLANVAMHTSAQVAHVTVELYSLSVMAVDITVRSESAVVDMPIALREGRRAYSRGDHEHGLVKVERLSSFLTAEPPTPWTHPWAGVRCHLSEPPPRNSGVFDAFSQVTPIYYEHEAAPTWRIDGLNYSGSNIEDAMSFALENHADRMFDLYFGANRDQRPQILGIEIAGRAQPTERARDRSPTVASGFTGVRSQDPVPAAIEARFAPLFEEGRVVFHGFDLGLSTISILERWSRLWELPACSSGGDVQARISAITT